MRHALSLALLLALPLAGCADEFAADALSAADSKSSCFVTGPSSLVSGTAGSYEAVGCPDGTFAEPSWSASGPLSLQPYNDNTVDAVAGSVSSPTSATLTYAVYGRRGQILGSASKTVAVTPVPQAPAISGPSEVVYEAGGCSFAYQAAPGPVTWSVSGPATFTPGGNNGVLETTGLGTVQLTATNAGGSSTKSISVVPTDGPFQCG